MRSKLNFIDAIALKFNIAPPHPVASNSDAKDDDDDDGDDDDASNDDGNATSIDEMST